MTMCRKWMEAVVGFVARSMGKGEYLKVAWQEERRG